MFMKFYKISKIFSLIMSSYYWCEFLQASQSPQDNLLNNVEAMCTRLRSKLLTNDEQEAMYQNYRNKKMTVEDVAETIEKDKKAREILLELKVYLEGLQREMKS